MAFHCIHEPTLSGWSSKNSSQADRSPPFANDHDVVICFGVNTNPGREHPSYLKDMFLEFATPPMVWP